MSKLNKSYRLLVGTYTDTCPGAGIHLLNFDTTSASLSELSRTQGVTNPSYLCFDKEKNTIYCVNENKSSSSISSFLYREEDSKMSPLNKVSSNGEDPCFILQNENDVIAVNYTSGSISVFSRHPDGRLSAAVQLLQHTGSSIIPKRQDSAHVHMACLSPDNKFVYFTDLGTDKIYVYSYLKNGGSNTLILKETINMTPGSGPRHITFHPAGHCFYIVTELAATVEVFSCSGQRPFLLQRAKLTGDKGDDSKSGGDIHLSNDGRYLYASNRENANTITVFKISDDGTLEQIQQLPSGGSGPRNFTIDPTGGYLLVAHQNSDSIVIFRRDTSTGLLAPTNEAIAICQPACLLFIAV